MATVNLQEVTKGADRYVVVRKSDMTAVDEMTAREYADLASGFAPKGISTEDWAQNLYEAWQIHDYGNGTLGKLRHGEFCELTDRFEIGVQRRDGRIVREVILKEKVDVTRTGGLTLSKRSADAWRDSTGIVSIESGVLTTAESLSGRRN